MLWKYYTYLEPEQTFSATTFVWFCRLWSEIILFQKKGSEKSLILIKKSDFWHFSINNLAAGYLLKIWDIQFFGNLFCRSSVPQPPNLTSLWKLVYNRILLQKSEGGRGWDAQGHVFKDRALIINNDETFNPSSQKSAPS